MTKMPEQSAGDQVIVDQFAALDGLSLAAIRKRWQRTYNAAVPPGLSRDLMVRGLAHKAQVAVHGGLTPANRRKLRTLAQQLESGAAAFDRTLKPGTRLVRTWHGRSHTVTVLKDGFEYDGDRYASLSVIAREITGARWSGPRFFGLKEGAANV